jgi:hypothetical protein
VLGFSAIADSPIAAPRIDAYLLLTSQSLSLSLSSTAVTAAANYALSSQSLVTTLNSPTIQAGAQYALDSQTLTTTLNAVTLETNNTLALDSQSLTLTPNSVTATAITYVPLVGQTLNLALNSVTVTADALYTLDSQSLTTTLNSATVSAAAGITPTGLSFYGYVSPVILSVGATVPTTGLVLTSTLNSFRKFWVDIFTPQIPEIPYDDCSIGSTPICYTPPEPTAETSIQGNWNEITLDAVVDGQDCSIGSQPICVGVNYTNTELLVTAVDLNGAITGISIKHTSLYDEVPPNPATVVATNGGANASFNIQYAQNVALLVEIANRGSGYIVGDTLFVLGGIGYNLPSTGKYPAALWSNITTTQTSNWVNIPT